MKTLAFDTSTKFLSIALLEDEDVRAEYHRDEGIRHSEVLVPTIKDMLARLGWDARDVGLVSVGLGPGSFTGLRIAVATVKGLAAALDSKVIGVPSMDAIIMNYRGGAPLAAPLLDAHKGKIYSCVYALGAPGGPERRTVHMLATVEELLAGLREKVVFFGDGAAKYRDTLESHSLAVYDESVDWYPRAADIGRIGLERSRSGTDDPAAIDPLYLHSKECNIILRDKGE